MLKRNWLTVSGVAFVALLFLLYDDFGLTEGTLLSFDVISTALLLGFAWLARRSAVEDQPDHAAAQLRVRSFVLTASILVSLVILVALGVELRPPNPPFEIALSSISLVLSWLFLNCVYALYYANVYYSAAPEPPGLVFPGTMHPTYTDFAYLSFVLGTTFQTPDVQVTSSALRRVVLVHGLLSFFFNVVVIALTVNVIGAR
ncbi:MAG TPA: DUF1345 domain-containing protein [Pseudomonadales bacterium]|nr:DUF1345 domain-containing protein [Pseudomonadales bacterium]